MFVCLPWLNLHVLYMFLSFTGSVAYLQMVDESNTRLMIDYVLETSHGDNEGK